MNPSGHHSLSWTSNNRREIKLRLALALFRICSGSFSGMVKKSVDFGDKKASYVFERCE